MARAFVLAALAGAMLACMSAQAQPPLNVPEDVPELDGGPPPLRVPKPAPAPKPAPTPATASQSDAAKLKAEQARLAAQAEAQKAEQARLTREAAELKAERTRLDARAAELAAGEKRLATLGAQQEADYQAKLAALETRHAAVTPEPAPPPLNTRRPARVRFTYDDAERACARAGMSEALDRRFHSARYDSAPRFDGDGLELRGVMRLDDRRGFLLVNTICTLDSNGDVVDFALQR